MHLMPLLAPHLCKSLIFGDVEVSSKGFKKIVAQVLLNDLCIIDYTT